MIEPLDLDDLRYDELVAQARALIPSLCPDWTDHNPADPGIALIELFAWLSELVGYRINRVPEASYRVFLSLLDPEQPVPAPPGGAPLPLPEAIRSAVAGLREIDRIVTLADLEWLIRHKWLRPGPDGDAGKWPPVPRVRCQTGRPVVVPRALRLVDLPGPGGIRVGRNTLLGTAEGEELRLEPARGHLSALLITDLSGWPNRGAYPPPPELLDDLRRFLAPRRLITSRIHVLGPRVVRLGLRARLHLASDGLEGQIRTRAESAIWSWLHPLTGGPDGTGWPFGRRIHPGDLYRLLDGLPGLDYVEGLELFADGHPAPGGVDTSAFEIVARGEVSFQVLGPAGE